MNIPVWLVWLIATTLAMMPLSILLMARMEDEVSPDREKCNADYESVSGEGILAIEEEELLAITHMIATVQMRQRWDKDITTID